jgi:sigma-B regulation protein RsbU (phosphoserine phosphatase)
MPFAVSVPFCAYSLWYVELPVAILSRLTRLQRITLILFIIVVTNWVMVSTTGYSLLGGDLFTFFFVVFLVLLAMTLIRPLMRKLVWRVRNRLLVTYFLIGALPLALGFVIVSLGLYILLAQAANYLLTTELDQRLDELQRSAERVAQDVLSGRKPSSIGMPGYDVIIRTGNRASALPETAPIVNFPSWVVPGFKGVVKTDAGSYFLSGAAAGERRVDVLVYRPLDEDLLSQLLPRLASVELFSVESEIRPYIGRRGDPDLPRPRPLFDSSNIIPQPGPRGFWDIDLTSAMLLPVRSTSNGNLRTELLILSSRPSVIIARLFSTLGRAAALPGIFLLITAGAFLFVEIVAIISSAQLTRSITRTVHDLHTGTRKIEAGDFSHRIPVRTKDQLSELATSFNRMTERIERLIIEVKEKEKLESELEIARQVQAQLFPKEVPKLKTLELAGICNPARVVSGDYYDFIPVDSRWTALVIGDISGKGISAALLMASVQSSLHAQLTMGTNGAVSTATLVARLNRQLYENTPPEKYATFYCGLYDDQSGRLLYTNAGHLAPILIRGNEVMRLESNGMVVGMFPEFPYEQSAVELQAGDLLTAFTDGITECENAQGVQFGDDRLTELLSRNSDKPLDEIVQIVTHTLRDWAHDLDNQDDRTMLLARRL